MLVRLILSTNSSFLYRHTRKHHKIYIFYYSTSWLNHKTPNFGSRECPVWWQLECHIFAIMLSVTNQCKIGKKSIPTRVGISAMQLRPTATYTYIPGIRSGPLPPLADSPYFRFCSSFAKELRKVYMRRSFLFFLIPFIVFAHLFSPPLGRNSDPGSHNKLFSPPMGARV